MMRHHKKKRSVSQLSARDKCHAIQRIRLGETKAAVARSIDVPESTLRGWVKNELKLRAQAFTMYSEYRDRNITQNKSPVNNGVTQEIVEPLNKIIKLDGSPETSPKPNGISKIDDIGTDAVDLSNYKKSPVTSQYDDMNNTRDKATLDLSTNSRIPYENNKHRSNGADVQTNDKNSPTLSMTAVSRNGMSANVPIPLGMSYQEIASNLNLVAQLTNQSNLSRVSGLNNAEQNGQRSAMSQGVSLSGQSNSQLNGSKKDKISIGDLNGHMKMSSVASLPYDKSQFWRQPLSGLNQLYPSTTAIPSLQQQQIQNMLPPTTLIQPLVSSTPQKNSSPSIDDVNSARFMQWCKYKQLLAEMMNDKSNGINHSTKQMDLNKEMSSIAPIPPLVEIGNKKEVIMRGTSNNMNNSTDKANSMSESDSSLISPSEAVQYGEKFLKWFESYSDPTITTQDLLQFQRLLQKIKKISERGNSPSFVSSKNRKRK